MTTARVTPQWLAQQAAKATAPVVEGWRDGVLSVWVPGRPSNPLNGTLAHAHWSKRARWARGWRERASVALWGKMLAPKWVGEVAHWPWEQEDAKLVTFTVYGPSRFDDDNLTAVVKPVRDALKDMAVIDDDRPSSGHEFKYDQAKPSRKPDSVYGIAVTIARRTDAREGLGT